MSRHSLYELILNSEELEDVDGDDPNKLVDIAGFDIVDWFHDCVLGWDDALGTYFLGACEFRDNQIWWFGNTPNEITTPWQIVAILKRVFGDTTLEFSSDLINTLISERNLFLREKFSGDKLSEMLIQCRGIDKFWENASPSAIPISYLREHFTHYPGHHQIYEGLEIGGENIWFDEDKHGNLMVCHRFIDDAQIFQSVRNVCTKHGASPGYLKGQDDDGAYWYYTVPAENNHGCYSSFVALVAS